MRKFVTVVASITLVITGAYALVTSLYPDTVDFPRIPMGVGSIGEVIGRIIGESDLANYAGDGTVENSEKLGGITATGYLKKKDICIAGEVIIGIDADGKGICGARTILLANMGTILEVSGGGVATVYHADGTSETIGTGTIFRAGDIIETDPSTSITLAFSDLSLIRLEPDTTIFLNLETLPDTTTLAKAIIENGGMWGRVLSETGGYLIGRDDVVVGVRGTSVYATESNLVSIAPKGGGVPGWDIIKVNPHGNGSIEIIHSSKNFGETVGTFTCRDMFSTTTSTGIRLGVGPISLQPTITGCQGRTDSVASDLTAWRDRIRARYEDKVIIAENTVKDLRYIANYLYSGSVVLSPNKRTLLTQEFQNTFPNNALGYDAICPDDGLPVVKKVFWPSLIGTGISIDPCRNDKTKILAKYTSLGEVYEKLYLSGGVIEKTEGEISSINKPLILYNNVQIKNILNNSSWTITMNTKTPTDVSNLDYPYLLRIVGDDCVGNIRNLDVYISRDSTVGIDKLYLRVGTQSIIPYLSSTTNSVNKIKITRLTSAKFNIKLGNTISNDINSSFCHPQKIIVGSTEVSAPNQYKWSHLGGELYDFEISY